MITKKIIEPITNTTIKIKKDGFYNTKTHKKEDTIIKTFDYNDKIKIASQIVEYSEAIAIYSNISDELNELLPKKLIK